MLDDVLILPFTFPEPNAALGGLMTLADDGLEIEFQRRILFWVQPKFRKIPFQQIQNVRVSLYRPGWFQPKRVAIEISTRSLHSLQGVPGTTREKLWLYTPKENLNLARCLEQVLLLKLIDR
jgi:hypothetical protein